jgi:serum/glucocorticoid-regulated kinase 2
MPYALVDFDKMQVLIMSVDGNPENPVWAGPSTQHKFDVSTAAELTVHLFLRNPNATPGSGRTQDICLGVARINPRFETLKGTAPTTKEQDLPLGFHGVGWVDICHGTGKLQIGVDYVETNPAGRLSIDGFELLKIVGQGTFGKVLQARKKDTNRIFALRTIRKAKLISQSEDAHTLAERSVLAQINSPFIAPLAFIFQSPSKFYLALPFAHGGKLFHHLSEEGRFDVNRCRFYTAELLCALECLHGFGVIYRDLKPANILLDYQGHIVLCDFGLCRLEMKDEGRIDTPGGAPELLLGKEYNETVDWWTLGALLYEMLTGRPPFNGDVHESLHFPADDAVPPAAKDILTKLLNKDPAERLGASGAAEIKSHPFFHEIDWEKLLQREYEPVFKPDLVCPSHPRLFAHHCFLSLADFVGIASRPLLYDLPDWVRTRATPGLLRRRPRPLPGDAGSVCRVYLQATDHQGPLFSRRVGTFLIKEGIHRVGQGTLCIYMALDNHLRAVGGNGPKLGSLPSVCG